MNRIATVIVRRQTIGQREKLSQSRVAMGNVIGWSRPRSLAISSEVRRRERRKQNGGGRGTVYARSESQFQRRRAA